jgi:predicted transposase YbfD/YdcC
VILRAKRSYWTIENCLHKVLEIAINEDRSWVRKDNTPQSYMIFGHMALKLLKLETTIKADLGKAFEVRLNTDYLLKVLA